MKFEKTVKFNGVDEESGYREEKIFEEAFSCIYRLFDYEDLTKQACDIFELHRISNSSSQIIGSMQGGLKGHISLTYQAVEKRFKVAKLLKIALERDCQIDYGNPKHTEVILESRKNQIKTVQTAIFIFIHAMQKMKQDDISRPKLTNTRVCS